MMMMMMKKHNKERKKIKKKNRGKSCFPYYSIAADSINVVCCNL